MEQAADNQNAITFLNMTGDITITWDDANGEKIKELVRKKMAEGYTFFTMRKVVIDAIQVKRKVGIKGIDKLQNLVIDDETFEQMIGEMDDRDLAESLKSGTGRLAKRRGATNQLDTVKRARDADEVLASRQALAVRPIAGG